MKVLTSSLWLIGTTLSIGSFASTPINPNLFPKSTADQKNVQHVVKGCPDGDFKEKYADFNVSLKDLVDNYRKENSTQFILESAKRRYPVGYTILNDRKNDNNCKQFFPKDSEKSPKGDLSAFTNLLAHECGHMYNFALNGATFETMTYFINENYTFKCEGGSIHSSKPTPKRAIIYKDKFSKDPVGYEDIYAQTYLVDSGNQGFPLLLEEYNQYVNDLAANYSLHDNINPAWNIKAGALNFAWYVQRYLYKTRKENPQGYKNIAGNSCYRNAILVNWGRMWHFMDAAKNVNNIGNAYKKLQPALEKPELMNEINLLRKAHGCVN